MTAATVSGARPSVQSSRNSAALRATGVIVVVALATLAAWAIFHDLHGLIGRRAFLWALLFAFPPVLPLGAAIFAMVLWRRHDFNAVVAGVVYGGLVGIGGRYHSARRTVGTRDQVGGPLC